jgi:hypothetical protein
VRDFSTGVNRAAEFALRAVSVAEGVLELVAQLEAQSVGESFNGGFRSLEKLRFRRWSG